MAFKLHLLLSQRGTYPKHIDSFKEETMNEQIEIMHIDPEYRITYFIISKGSFVRSSVPIEKAGLLLDRPGLDLIISEPHNKTILKDPSKQNKHFQELGRIRTVSDVHRLSQNLNQPDRAAA
jgi:hypothetical protein